MTAESKVWDKAAVQTLLVTNDRALGKALWAIFQRQTATEKASRQTIEHNGRGFTGMDAEFLSDIARRLPHYDYRMTVRQIAKVRPKMLKYWRQLLEEIEAKGGQVNYRTKKARKRSNAPACNVDNATARKDDFALPSKEEMPISANRVPDHPMFGMFQM